MIRSALDPVSEFRERFEDVRRIASDIPSAGHHEAAQRRTSSFKASKRKPKRKHHASLESISLRWAQKRGRVEDDTWDGSILPMASGFSLKTISENLQKRGAVHDASYERWWELKVSKSEHLQAIFSLVFDPAAIPKETNVRGDTIIMYDSERFPENPICPIRIVFVDNNTVHIGVHSSCSDRVQEAIREAAKLASISVYLQQQRYYMFILFGLCTNQWSDLGLSDSSSAEVPEQTSLRCPVSDYDVSTSMIEDRFFSQEFGTTLSYNPNCTVVRPRNTISKMAAPNSTHTGLRTFKFQIGLKARQRVPCVLFLIEEKDPAQWLWNKFMQEKLLWLGINDLEQLYAQLRVPSFPRDFPDTESYRLYWARYQEDMLGYLSRRPPGKRLMISSAPKYPSFDGMLGIENCNAVRVIRSWQHAEIFFAEEFIPNGLYIDDLLLPVSIAAPRTRRAGVKFNYGFSIYLASKSDYELFNSNIEMQFKDEENRVKIGVITSVHRSSAETYGRGFVSVHGILQVLQDAYKQERRRKRSRLMVLVLNPNTSHYSAGFISVAPS